MLQLILPASPLYEKKASVPEENEKFYFCFLLPYYQISFHLCTYQHFPQERVWGSERFPRGIRKFVNLVSNSPPIGKNLVSKIPWMGHEIC